MLRSVTITPKINIGQNMGYYEKIALPLGRTKPDGYNPEYTEFKGYRIRSIEGLSPVPAQILTADLSGIAGSVYNMSKVQPRTITLNIDYIPYWDHDLEPIESNTHYKVGYLKEMLYGVIRPGSEVDLKFAFNYPGDIYEEFYWFRYIKGYVESHDAFTFEKDGRATVSIYCPQPYFEGETIEKTGFAGTDIDQVISISTGGSMVDLGVEVDINLKQDTRWLRVENTATPNEHFDLYNLINIDGGEDILKSGRDIVYSSVPGDKRAYITTEVSWVTIPLIGYFDYLDIDNFDYRWLRAPANETSIFRLRGEVSPGVDLPASQDFTIRATPRYLGI